LLYASRLYVLYVVENAVPRFLRAGTNRAVHVEDVAMQSLMDFIHRHIGADRKVIPVVRIGGAEDEILRFAEEQGMDLVVISRHDWTGWRHILLGSVAERVVRRSTAPRPDGEACTDAGRVDAHGGRYVPTPSRMTCLRRAMHDDA